MYPVLPSCWRALLHLKHAIPAADAEKPNCVVRVILTSLTVNTVPRLRPAALAQLDNPRWGRHHSAHPMSACSRACLHLSWFGLLPCRCPPVLGSFYLAMGCPVPAHIQN